MQTGTIARIMDKGYGFITRDGDDGKDLFFHAKELAEGVEFETLQPGQKVTFEVTDGPKGPQAVNVALA